MANTQYITANRLTTEANNTTKLVFIIGLPIVVVLCFAFKDMCWGFLGMFAIILMKAGTIKRAGAKGEDSTLSVLSTLPDSYTIINQVAIPNKESRVGYTELDFIVVGPNGAFVVEVKNNNSKIYGNEDGREWKILKIGRNGTPYDSSMKNPIKQVKGQIWALSNFLKERGYKTWLQGVVFLSNTDSTFVFDGVPSVPVIHKFGLTEYILNFKPKYTPNNLDLLINDLALLKKSEMS